MIPALVRKQATVLMYGHGHTGVDLGVMNRLQFMEPTLVSPAGASGGHDADGPAAHLRAGARARRVGRRRRRVADHAPLSRRSRPCPPPSPAITGCPDYVKGVVVL